MKRFRLPTKLALAIVPIGLVALITGALVSWTFLDQARGEERVSSAARVAADAMEALVAVSSERSAILASALGDSPANLETRQAASDRAIESLRDSVRELVPRAAGPASGIASTIFSHSSLTQARLDDARAGDPLSDETQDLFDEVGNRLITIASQSTLYFGDAGPAREGAGAVSLARASYASFQQEQLLVRFQAGEAPLASEDFEQTFAALESTVVDWLNNADDNSPTVRALGLARSQVHEGGFEADPETFLFDRNEVLAEAASEILGRVAGAADRAAATVRAEAATVAAIVLGVLFVTVILALILGRSTVRRVRSVTAAAQHVADVELPKLVDALSNPKGQLEGSVPIELENAGPDEVGELARSFSSLHGTLVEVANRQMEILRRGVSEIFVTLARRNGSLVDRQLALIDELESRQEDPEILDGYYKLDHLATRMRRNAESLLVLAGSESPRMWSDPLDMGEVVRAALGEVDEYQRVDVLALEPARLKGRAVTDLAHLMSELLDNATQFSPPSERVRVTGLFDDAGYVITIADSGLGISDERLRDLNRLIVDPPVLGLALEPTLGMYVVARLAARHGIAVRLVPGVPGTTVRITLPRTLLETTGDSKGKDAPVEAATASADNGTSPRPKTATIPSYAFRSGQHPSPPPATREGPRSRGAEAVGPSEDKRPDQAAPRPSPSPAVAGSSPAQSQPESRPHRDLPATPTRRPEGAETPLASPEGRAGPEPIPGDRREVPISPPVVPPDQALPSSPEEGHDERATPPPAVRPATPGSSPGPEEQRGVGGAAVERPSSTPSPRPPEDELPRRPTAPPTEQREPSAPRTAPPRPERSPAAPPSARPVDRSEVSPSSASKLPIRRPGSSFRGEVSTEGSTSVSQRGAEGIRSALDGYRLGRDIASHPPRPHDRPEASDSEEGSET